MTHARVILLELTLTHRQSIVDPPPLYLPFGVFFPLYLPFGVFFNRLFLPPIGRFLYVDHRQAWLTGSISLTIGRLC
jgi:hypothetical protein